MHEVVLHGHFFELAFDRLDGIAIITHIFPVVKRSPNVSATGSSQVTQGMQAPIEAGDAQRA